MTAVQRRAPRPVPPSQEPAPSPSAQSSLPAWFGPYPVTYAAVRGLLAAAMLYFGWLGHAQWTAWANAPEDPKVLDALLWGLQIAAKIGAAFSFLWLISVPRYKLRHALLVIIMAGAAIGSAQLDDHTLLEIGGPGPFRFDIPSFLLPAKKPPHAQP